MRRSIAILVCFVLVLAGCASTTAYRVERDAATGAVTGETLSQYFEIRALSPDGALGVHLVLDIETREVIVISNCPIRATAYVHNLSASAVDFTAGRLAVDGVAVLAAPSSVRIEPGTYRQLALGRATIPGCRFEVAATLTWSRDGDDTTSALTLQRSTVEQIARDNAQWRGRDKSVPEFFDETL